MALVKSAPKANMAVLEKRSAIAKALWFLEAGNERSSDPMKLQAEFDAQKDEMLLKAIKFEKLLGNLKHEITIK